MTDMTNAGPAHETGTRQNADSATEYNPPTEAALLAAARGYCVIVASAEGKYRRRLFLSLHSAEKAVQRAKANGRYAAMVLAVIVPTEAIQ